MSDPYAGQGGSYTLDSNGNRVLVEQTIPIDNAGCAVSEAEIIPLQEHEYPIDL